MQKHSNRWSDNSHKITNDKKDPVEPTGSTLVSEAERLAAQMFGRPEGELTTGQIEVAQDILDGKAQGLDGYRDGSQYYFYG